MKTFNNYTATNFTLPPEGVLVHTKISDKHGDRNFQRMTRKGNLWFGKDGTYVYYTPTHWSYIDDEINDCYYKKDIWYFEEYK